MPPGRFPTKISLSPDLAVAPSENVYQKTRPAYGSAYVCSPLKGPWRADDPKLWPVCSEPGCFTEIRAGQTYVCTSGTTLVGPKAFCSASAIRLGLVLSKKAPA